MSYPTNRSAPAPSPASVPEARSTLAPSIGSATHGALAAPDIRAGHRELLETLRELLHDGDEGRLEENARGLLAFLRNGLLPFARREERTLAASEDIRESVAFEHAFLEVEIERFGEQAAVLFSEGLEQRSDRGRLIGDIETTLHRIEAILELHVLKEEDRVLCAPGEAALAMEACGETLHGRPARSGADSMSEPEAERFLLANRWGILSTIGEGRPYGVPVSYAFDGRAVYFATGPGRKADNIGRGGAVCLTVTQIEDEGIWSCVVVTGDVQWVEGVGSQTAAALLLARRSRPGGLPIDRTAVARLLRARIARISPSEITGRRRGELP